MSEHVDSTVETAKRSNEDGAEDRSPKRLKTEDSADVQPPLTNLPSDVPAVVSRLGLKPVLPILPPSLDLITGGKTDLSQRKGFIGEREVGIIGYVGDPAFAGVQGVIKQRYALATATLTQGSQTSWSMRSPCQEKFYISTISVSLRLPSSPESLSRQRRPNQRLPQMLRRLKMLPQYHSQKLSPSPSTWTGRRQRPPD